ncbi:MAG TPA: response regulator transcription factor [Gaiellaceae bacterium]|nr:response regulator transcription factor [Gaiellaceae bacterium]
MRPIRLLLADDHALVLEALRFALESESEIEIVGEAKSGSEVLPRVAETEPDVILLDIRMPGLDGLQLLDRLGKQHPQAKVVILSGAEEPELAAEAMRRGAKAFLGKGIDPADVAPIIRRVFEGEVVSESFATGPVGSVRAAEEFGLTGREREILERVATGRSNKQIAAEFWLSEQTIKYHLTNVYRKLGVSSRTEAARFAYDHGLAGTPWPGDQNQHQSPSVG